jgi:hypothetical protein
MNKNSFHYADPFVSPSICDSFSCLPHEKTILLEMINEWNSRVCVSDLCKKWKKDRPVQVKNSNLTILLFNVQSLNTRIDEVDLLLNENKPHICILTE